MATQSNLLSPDELTALTEGIAALDKAHPEVRCWTAAIDSHLNEIGYIIPGPPRSVPSIMRL